MSLGRGNMGTLYCPGKDGNCNYEIDDEARNGAECPSCLRPFNKSESERHTQRRAAYYKRLKDEEQIRIEKRKEQNRKEGEYRRRSATRYVDEKINERIAVSIAERGG
jgi:hypothetical protein